MTYIFSLPPLFETWRTCTQTFGTSCQNNAILDDAIGECNGTQSSAGDPPRIKEVYINATAVLPNSGLNVTCEARQASGNNSIEVWYNDTTSWYMIKHWDTPSLSSGINYSVGFNVNSTIGEHIVRCMIRYCGSGECPITGSCVNDTYATTYDNDDVNFTVTDYPKYSSWNINVSDNSSQTRSNAVLAYAHWDKNLSHANIKHNGTGSFWNYTFSTTGNWTNYTLDLSNTTYFNKTGLIEVSYIRVNDTYSLENVT